jgi:hypothetical protein
MVVHFGKPVSAAGWKNAWNQNPEKAADDFTTHLEQAVRALSIDTRDEAGERIIGHWEEMLQNAAPVSGEEAFYRSQKLVSEHLDNKVLTERTEAWFGQIQTLGLHDAGLQMAPNGIGIGQTAMLLLGWPFFAAGYLFWALPCYLPLLLAKKLKLYIGYDSNVKILAGTLTFAVALAWAPWVVGVHNQWAAGAVMLCCIALGYFTEQYQDLLGKWRAFRRFRRLPEEERRLLQAQRQEILSGLGVKENAD